MFGWAIDDVLLFEPQGLDAELTSLSVNANQNVPVSIPITGVVSNVGSELITSLILPGVLEEQWPILKIFQDLTFLPWNIQFLTSRSLEHISIWSICFRCNGR